MDLLKGVLDLTAGDVDILLTNDWPEGVLTGVQRPEGLDNAGTGTL